MITNETFEAIKTQLVQRLTLHLPKQLYYHGVHHTLDVLEQAERIAIEEKISDPKALLLVKLAALYHDTGFLDTYKGHEERSCEIMLHDLGGNSLTTGDLDRISGMIMATKIPQNPANLYRLELSALL